MTVTTIVYPTDPLGVVPGGTDTCIRDILRCAPDDVTMQLVGVTTMPEKYPVGEWSDCVVSGKPFRFYPLMDVSNLEKQMRIPLSAKFTFRLFGKDIFQNTDVIQVNRMEPVLAMLRLKLPKIMIIHQNMKVLTNKNSDIRWKYFPGIYFKIESFIINRLKEVFIVREDAVNEYKARFPEKNNSIHFLPTWMNPELFYFEKEEQKRESKKNLFDPLGIPSNDKVMIFVGRFDHQKNPILLIDAVAKVFSQEKDASLVLVGDGVLRDQVEARISHHALEGRIILLGAVSQDRVAEYLRASDLLLLSSAYEGMPRCVVESLGCGVPVVTTDAGEVTLLVKNDINGYIIEDHSPDTFANSIVKALGKLEGLRGQPCLDSVDIYRADIVLSNLYETYRHYAK